MRTTCGERSEDARKGEGSRAGVGGEGRLETARGGHASSGAAHNAARSVSASPRSARTASHSASASVHPASAVSRSSRAASRPAHPLRRALGSLARTTAALALAALLSVGVLAACSSGPAGSDAASTPSASGDAKVQTFTPSSGSPKQTLKVASGSENKEAADAIQKAADDSGVAVELHYMGSLDIMSVLKDGGQDYDAVWPASSIWISMGDTNHLVKNAQSTSTTPVVLGVAKSKAVELGWADGSGATKPVSTAQIIDAVSSGKLAFAMTSATQSNSGASAYLAFLTALSGKDTPLTADDLANADLQDKMTKLLSGVDRSSGSSDWLKDMVVKDPDAHPAMVNYESLVAQANKELEQAGHEPMLVIYPSDGIAVSDSPLGYVDRGQGKDDAFSSFQKALSSDDAKLLLERVGRRTGLGGKVANPNDDQVKATFRADWGISTDSSVLKAVPMPAADVTTSALDLYQTKLRRPSLTIWVVDYSGSMQGEGKSGVVDGLTQALDPTQSKQSMIQPADGDVNVLVPFSSRVMDTATATGTNTQQLLSQAQGTEATGGTNIYAGLDEALRLAKSSDLAKGRTVAIVLMTDGMSETFDQEQFEDDYNASGKDIPVFSIMFGDADPTQLDELSELTNGKTFDGRTGDLASVFRTVKGYN